MLDYRCVREQRGHPSEAFTQLFDAATSAELPLGKYGPDEQCLTALDPVNPLMVVIDPPPKYKRGKKVTVKVGERQVEVPDDRLVLETPGPFTLRVIDPFTGREVGSVKELKDFPAVGQVALSRDGKTLALLRSGSVVVFDTQTSAKKKSWTVTVDDKGVDMRTARLMLSSDAASVALYWLPANGLRSQGPLPDLPPKLAFVWDAATGVERFKPVRTSSFGWASFSPDGRVFFCNEEGPMTGRSYLVARDVTTGKELHSNPNVALRQIMLFNAGTASKPDTITYFTGDPESFGLREINSGIRYGGISLALDQLPPDVWNRSVGIAPDGQRVAVMLDGCIKVFPRAPEPAILLRFDYGHQLTAPNRIGGGSITFSPDGSRLAYHDASTLRLWDLRADPRYRVMSVPPGRHVVQISPDQRTMMFSGGGGFSDRVRVLVDTKTGEEIGRFQSDTLRHFSVYQPDFFTPDGSRLISICLEKVLERDPRTGAVRSSYSPPAVWRNAVSWHTKPDSSRTPGILRFDGTKNVFDPLPQPEVYEFLDYSRRRILVRPAAVVVSETRKAGEPERVYPARVLEGPDWKEVCRLPDLPAYAEFQMTPDRNFLFLMMGLRLHPTDSKRSYRQYRVFDLRTGRETDKVKLPDHLSYIAESTPDGRYALMLSSKPSTGSNERTLAKSRKRGVWDFVEGRVILDSFGRPVEDLSWFSGQYWRYRLAKTLAEADLDVPPHANNPDGLRVRAETIGNFGAAREQVRIYDGSPFVPGKRSEMPSNSAN